MNIDKNSWHAHLFFECLKMCAVFTDKMWMVDQYSQQTNLCHYMRVVLVYAPLIIAIHVGAIIATVWVLIIRPIFLFGLTGYFSTLKVIGIFGLAGATVIVLAFLIHRWLSTRPRKISYREPGRIVESIEMFGEYLSAKKQRICPLIRFKENANV